MDAPPIIHSHNAAAFFCEQLDRVEFSPPSRPRILVVGCGEGHEAVFLQQKLNAVVDAIDVELADDDAWTSQPDVHVRMASALDMPFENDRFDAVFYHHVIEHVEDPRLSLKEIARVMSPQGWLLVGTPNRHRLASSVGAHKQRHWDPTLSNKLGDNIEDWRRRLKGTFRNELGAHAGFSQSELDAMLETHFANRQWITRDYLRDKYPSGWKGAATFLATIKPLIWCCAPSIYVLCHGLRSSSL